MEGLEIGIGNWNLANHRTSLPLQHPKPGGTGAPEHEIGIAARFANGRDDGRGGRSGQPRGEGRDVGRPNANGGPTAREAGAEIPNLRQVRKCLT